MTFSKGLGVRFIGTGIWHPHFISGDGFFFLKKNIMQTVALVTLLPPDWFGMFQAGRCVGPAHRETQSPLCPQHLEKRRSQVWLK